MAIAIHPCESALPPAADSVTFGDFAALKFPFVRS